MNLTHLPAKLLRAFARRMKPVVVYDAARYPLHEVAEIFIPTPLGAARALLYYPKLSGGARLPVFLNLHGGGFVAGVPEHDDPYCRRLAHNLGCLVVNLDYALAPEHPFPAAPRQCFAVLEWLAQEAGQLGIDPWRMAVGGHSAGGNLAAAVARQARGHSALRVLHQVIDYPAMNLALDPAEKRSALAKPLLGPRLMRFFNRCYLSDPSQAHDPLASPALAAPGELAGMPPATVIVAEYDVLRAEAEVYARRLREDGVRVVERMFAGCDHMFTHLGPEAPAEAAWQLIEDSLRGAFYGMAEQEGKAALPA